MNDEERRLRRVTADYWTPDSDPMPVTEFCAAMGEMQRRIPDQYQASAWIQLTGSDNGRPGAIEVGYERPETDEEMGHRIAWSRHCNEMREKIERAGIDPKKETISGSVLDGCQFVGPNPEKPVYRPHGRGDDMTNDALLRECRDWIVEKSATHAGWRSGCDICGSSWDYEHDPAHDLDCLIPRIDAILENGR